MSIEITGTTLQDRIVTIEAVDVSEEHLQYMECMRDDGGFERTLTFSFDTKEADQMKYLQKFMHRQKITKDCRTWGEALMAVVGIHTQISGKYLVPAY